jgi:hypothetical protein
MLYEKPRLELLSFDPDGPADPRPLGELVLSARDVVAVVYSALEQIDEDEARLTAIKLDVLKAVGEGRVGLGVYRAILGIANLRDD